MKQFDLIMTLPIMISAVMLFSFLACTNKIDLVTFSTTTSVTSVILIIFFFFLYIVYQCQESIAVLNLINLLFGGLFCFSLWLFDSIKYINHFIIFNIFFCFIFYIVYEFVLKKFNLLKSGYLIIEKFKHGNKHIYFDEKKYSNRFDFFYYIKYLPFSNNENINPTKNKSIKYLLASNIIRLEEINKLRSFVLFKKKGDVLSKIRLWLFLPIVLTYSNLMANFFFFRFYDGCPIYYCHLTKMILVAISGLWVLFSVLYIVSINSLFEDKFSTSKRTHKIQHFIRSGLELVKPKKFKGHIFADQYINIKNFIDMMQIVILLITGGFLSLLTILNVLF